MNNKVLPDVRDFSRNIESICREDNKNNEQELDRLQEELRNKRVEYNSASLTDKFRLNGEIKNLESRMDRIRAEIRKYEKISNLNSELSSYHIFYNLPPNIKSGLEKLGGFIPQDSKFEVQSAISSITSVAVSDINAKETSQIDKTADDLKFEMEHSYDLQTINGRLGTERTSLTASQYTNSARAKALENLSKASHVFLSFEKEMPYNSDLAKLEGLSNDIKEYRNDLDLEDRKLNKLIGGFPKYKNDMSDLICANATLDSIDLVVADIRNENRPEFDKLINYLSEMKKNLPKEISKLQNQTKDFDIGYIAIQVDAAKQKRQEEIRIQQIKSSYEKKFTEYITLKRGGGTHEQIVKMESELEELGSKLPVGVLQDAQNQGYLEYNHEQIEKGIIPQPMAGHTPPEDRVYDDNYPKLDADKPTQQAPAAPSSTGSSVNPEAEQYIAQCYEKYCAATADKRAIMSYSQYKMNVLKDALNYGRIGNFELEDEEIEKMMEEAGGRGR